MSEWVAGVEIFIALGCVLIGCFLVWIALPRGKDIKFKFLRTETAQVLYTVFCLTLIAFGAVFMIHGLSVFAG